MAGQQGAAIRDRQVWAESYAVSHSNQDVIARRGLLLHRCRGAGLGLEGGALVLHLGEHGGLDGALPHKVPVRVLNGMKRVYDFSVGQHLPGVWCGVHRASCCWS